MDRVILAAALIGVAGVAAVVLSRRKPDAPAQTGWTVPAQLDRDDFDSPHAPWLVVVFSSSTCAACGGVLDRATVVASEQVAVQDIEVGSRKDLHDRYGIDAVPTVVVADADGVVRASFVGPVSSVDLWGVLAGLREPGSVPSLCDGVRSQVSDGAGPRATGHPGR